MATTPDQNQILAFAVYELRLLLSGHLGAGASSAPEVRAAAKLSYALHNQAAAVLSGKSFDPAQAVEAIAQVDREFGESFVQQLMEATKRAV